MVEEQTTKTIAYVALGLMFLAMAWFIARKAGENRDKMLEAASPKIAGDDELEGGKKTLNNLTNQMKMPSMRWQNYLVRMKPTTINRVGILHPSGDIRNDCHRKLSNELVHHLAARGSRFGSHLRSWQLLNEHSTFFRCCRRQYRLC